MAVAILSLNGNGHYLTRLAPCIAGSASGLLDAAPLLLKIAYLNK